MLAWPSKFFGTVENETLDRFLERWRFEPLFLPFQHPNYVKSLKHSISNLKLCVKNLVWTAF